MQISREMSPVLSPRQGGAVGEQEDPGAHVRARLDNVALGILNRDPLNFLDPQGDDEGPEGIGIRNLRVNPHMQRLGEMSPVPSPRQDPIGEQGENPRARVLEHFQAMLDAAARGIQGPEDQGPLNVLDAQQFALRIGGEDVREEGQVVHAPDPYIQNQEEDNNPYIQNRKKNNCCDRYPCLCCCPYVLYALIREIFCPG